MAKTFSTATAFKSSLDARLRTRAAETNLPIQTIQLKLVMERLLARLFDDPNSPWLLKGGFAMDLRYRPHARMTKDIDLSVSVTRHLAREKLRERIQTAADIDRGDYFSFRISSMKAVLTNAPRGGGRARARSHHGGRGVRRRRAPGHGGAEGPPWPALPRR